ncbi:hypothetical protein BOSP111201_11715 [Bordetella sputigena]
MTIRQNPENAMRARNELGLELRLPRIGVLDVEITGSHELPILNHRSRIGTRDHRHIVRAGDDHRHCLRVRAAIAVVHLHGEGFGLGLAFAERLDRGIVHRVRPLAGLIDRQRPIVALRVARHGPRVTVVHVYVGNRQLSRHRRRRVFLDRAGRHAADLRRVVRAVDRDGHFRRRAVGRQDSDLLGQALALAQLLHRRVAVVQVVGPVAVRIDVERTVRRHRVGLRLEERLIVVGIDDVQLAAGAQRRVLLHLALVAVRRMRRDHRHVVGAVDGDGDRAGGRAVQAGHRIGLDNALAAAQGLHRRVVVGHGIVVRTVRVERQRAQRRVAVAGAAVEVRARLEAALAGVHIGDGQLSRSHQVAGVVDVLVFGHHARAAAQYGNVIRAVDGDGHFRRRAVGRQDGDLLRQALASAQFLHGRIAVVQVVGPVAVRVDVERTVRRHRVGLRLEERLIVIGIDDVQLAAGAQRRIFLDFALVAIRRVRRDHRHVVGAVDGDGDRAGGRAVRAGHRIGLDDALAAAQRLHRRVVVGHRVGVRTIGVEGQRAQRGITVARAAVEMCARLEAAFTRVRVGDRQLAAGHQVAVVVDALVLGHRARAAAQLRHIVGAGNRDSDVLDRRAAVAVIDQDVESFLHLLARRQRLRRCLVDGIGPLAGLVDADGAVLALRFAGHRPAVRVAGVDIGHGQLAGYGLLDVLGGSRGARATDGRDVVRAVDGDGHRRFGTVRRLDDERLGQMLAHRQLLHLRVVVRQVVGPVTFRVDREGAVLAGRAGLRLEEGLVVIRVDDVQLAFCRQDDVFLDSVGIRAGFAARGDDGHVVGAGHRQGQRRDRRTAFAVGNRVVDGGGLGLARRQALEILARVERIRAVRANCERAAGGTRHDDAFRRHIPVAGAHHRQRVAVWIDVAAGTLRIASQDVAGYASVFRRRGGVIDGQRARVGNVPVESLGDRGAAGVGRGDRDLIHAIVAALRSGMVDGAGDHAGVRVDRQAGRQAVGRVGQLVAVVDIREVAGHIDIDVLLGIDAVDVVDRGGGRRVVQAVHRHGDGRGGRIAEGIGNRIGQRAGRGLADAQVVIRIARIEDVAAIREHRERAAGRAGHLHATRRHGPTTHGLDEHRVAVGIGVVGQDVASHERLLRRRVGVVAGGRGIIGRGVVVRRQAGGGQQVDRGGTGAGIGQIQRRGGFDDAGQAHEAAAAGIAAAGHQGGRGIQVVERVLAILQRGQQAVGIGAGGRGHGGFGAVHRLPRHIGVEGHVAVFADRQRHAAFGLQGHGRTRGGHDFGIGGDPAAGVQLGQRAIAVADPGTSDDLRNYGGGGEGHLFSSGLGWRNPIDRADWPILSWRTGLRIG